MADEVSCILYNLTVFDLVKREIENSGRLDSGGRDAANSILEAWKKKILTGVNDVHDAETVQKMVKMFDESSHGALMKKGLVGEIARMTFVVAGKIIDAAIRQETDYVPENGFGKNGKQAGALDIAKGLIGSCCHAHFDRQPEL